MQLKLGQTRHPRKKRQRKRCPKETTGTGGRQKRQPIRRQTPLHITLRLREGLPNLRSRKGMQLIMKAFKGAQEKGLRIIHFAVLSNHIHLIVEVANSEILYKSMRSLTTRLGIYLRRWARPSSLRRAQIKKLGLFRGRYHVHILKTAREVKNALHYVLLNPCKHFKKGPYIDFYTSSFIFKDWKLLIGRDLLYDLNSKEKKLEHRGLVKEWKSRLSTFLDKANHDLLAKSWRYVS